MSDKNDNLLSKFGKSKFGSLFVTIPDPESEVEVTAPAPQSSASTKTSRTRQSSVFSIGASDVNPSKVVEAPVASPTAQPATVVFNNKIAADLEQLLIDNAPKETNHLDLMRTAEALKVAIPNEDARFNAAFATLKVNDDKITPAAIAATTEHSLNILNKELGVFNEHTEAQLKVNVDDLEAGIAGDLQEIKTKQEQIATLEREIIAAEKGLEQTKAKIETNRSRINEAAETFRFTVGSMANQIKEIGARIRTIN